MSQKALLILISLVGVGSLAIYFLKTIRKDKADRNHDIMKYTNGIDKKPKHPIHPFRKPNTNK